MGDGVAGGNLREFWNQSQETDSSEGTSENSGSTLAERSKYRLRKERRVDKGQTTTCEQSGPNAVSRQRAGLTNRVEPCSQGDAVARSAAKLDVQSNVNQRGAGRNLGPVKCRPRNAATSFARKIIQEQSNANPTSSTSAAQPSAKHCRSPRHAEDDTQQKYTRWHGSDELTSGRIGTWVPRGDSGADERSGEVWRWGLSHVLPVTELLLFDARNKSCGQSSF